MVRIEQPASMVEYFKPVSIKGTRVALEPLSPRHLEDLAAAGADESIWRWLPNAHHLPGSMATFIQSALAAHGRQTAWPFATIDLVNKKAVGSTRYHHIEPEHRRLEVGVTWLGTGFQRSYINTEAKLLQFWFAFDVLKCRRVELKADVDNQKSRTAILRLGATQEGIFRKHMLYPDGRNRDNVYFSVVDDDWSRVRALLETKLGYKVNPVCEVQSTAQ
jgi:RimJ/RimL family protein N-acetyltransferase